MVMQQDNGPVHISDLTNIRFRVFNLLEGMALISELLFRNISHFLKRINKENQADLACVKPHCFEKFLMQKTHFQLPLTTITALPDCIFQAILDEFGLQWSLLLLSGLTAQSIPAALLIKTIGPPEEQTDQTQRGTITKKPVHLPMSKASALFERICLIKL